MWRKAETFPSSHFCILAFFPTESDCDMPASLFFLCRGTGGMGMLTSAPDCSAMLTPGCPREEFCCRAFWVSGGWSFWQLVCSEKVPTKMWNVVFQQGLIQLNVVQAYFRDYSCLTKFDIVLQRLKQNRFLKRISLFPSQIEPVLTNVLKKLSVKNPAQKMSVWKNDDKR